MREHRFSRAAYRLLLRTYPREFRERFARDLEIDFLEIGARARSGVRVVARPESCTCSS
jgi:hypothetical protein